MSTIPLLPPERSHICIAFASLLWAQSFAGSGVGAAAASLGAVDAPDAAGADGATADDPADEGADDAPGVHAVSTRTAVIARTGNLSGLVILGSSISRRPGRSLLDCCHGFQRADAGSHQDDSNRVPTIVCNHGECQVAAASNVVRNRMQRLVCWHSAVRHEGSSDPWSAQSAGPPVARPDCPPRR